MESPSSFLTLHRNPFRHDFFSKAISQDPFFDTATQVWIVANPSHCRALISSSKLCPASYAEDYHALETRFGIDFSSLTFAFDHIPLCLHGDRHEGSRRRVSEFLAVRKATVSARIPQAVAEKFSVFQREGRVDVMKDAVIPLVLDIISTLIDLDISSAVDCRSASLVFDKSIGINKRRRIASEIATLRAWISSRLGAKVGDEDVGLRLALLILGKDALIGTLGESLYRLLDRNSSRRLADIVYPDLPPDTGVPFIERVVVHPFKLSACDFARGDRVRIFLQAFAYTDEPKYRTNFFGAGVHACLGRPLSIEIWSAVTGFLSKLPLRAEVLSYSTRTSDFVFTCPEILEVRLSP